MRADGQFNQEIHPGSDAIQRASRLAYRRAAFSPMIFLRICAGIAAGSALAGESKSPCGESARNRASRLTADRPDTGFRRRWIVVRTIARSTIHYHVVAGCGAVRCGDMPEL